MGVSPFPSFKTIVFFSSVSSHEIVSRVSIGLTPFHCSGTWFVLADLCAILEIGNPSDVAKRPDQDDLDTVEVIDSIGRKQRVNAVNKFDDDEKGITSSYTLGGEQDMLGQP